MYGYNSLKFIILFLFLFSGCSNNQIITPKIKQYSNENLDILIALEYESHNNIKDYKKAIEIYEKLEKHTNNFIYMQKAITLSLHTKDLKIAQKLIDEALTKYPTHNKQLLKLKSYVYLMQSKLDSALKVSLEALKKYPNDAEFYDIVGTLYFQKKEYKKAQKYYESSYMKQKSINSLLNLSNILYTYLNKKLDAISYLETHSRLYEYSPRIYAKLINIYTEEKDYKSLAMTYNRMYKHTKKEYYALKVVEIYIQTNKKDKAIHYLEKNHIYNKLLLDLYKEKKEYKKAVKLARKLYRKTKDIDILAQVAMMEYELYIAPHKNLTKQKRKKLRNIIANMKLVISKKATPTYLNYLGYILIDNNIAVKKGIKYVEQSLKDEPNNPYYLDSLAWGYYKIRYCKKAYKIMKKVIKELGQDNSEVKYHLNQIIKCK